MPRAIWKGSIVFGLVEIPVELLSAERKEEKLNFNFLDKRDFSPVGYERVSKSTGKVVPWEEIVRGYEYEEGEYVVLSEQDFKRANPKVSRSIEIVGFVRKEEIEPFYYVQPCYIEPVQKNSKGYALLRETLRKTQKVGIAKIVIHTREHLASLDVRGHALTLATLRFAHELHEPAVVETTTGDLRKITPKEVEMATQIVEGMMTTWDPKDYRDDYHADLLALIRKKVKAGQTKTVEEPAEAESEKTMAEVVDLMPLLRKSVERAGVAKRAAKKVVVKKAGSKTQGTRRRAGIRRSRGG